MLHHPHHPIHLLLHLLHLSGVIVLAGCAATVKTQLLHTALHHSHLLLHHGYLLRVLTAHGGLSCHRLSCHRLSIHREAHGITHHRVTSHGVTSHLVTGHGIATVSSWHLARLSLACGFLLTRSSYEVMERIIQICSLRLHHLRLEPCHIGLKARRCWLLDRLLSRCGCAEHIIKDVTCRCWLLRSLRLLLLGDRERVV